MARTYMRWILPCSLLFLTSCALFRTAPEPVDTTTPAPYERLIPDHAESQAGLFDVHRVNEDLFYEIPDSLLGRDLLMVSRVAQVPADFFRFYSGGFKTAEQVFTLERRNRELLLRKRSFNRVAADTLPIYESVRVNNFEPIVARFEIEAENPETGSSVIRMNDFFEEDVRAISGLAGFLRNEYQIRRLDPDRSYIDTVRAFPENIEVAHVMTYEAGSPPSASHTQTLSLQMHQSMVLLPETPMRYRLADHRVGWLTVDQIDFGSDEQKADERSLIRRWRLEPEDLEAYKRGELVKPKDPIVFHVDPATPEPFVPYVKKGVEDWQEAFEKAGFKNAIEARLPPDSSEDPDFSPEDIRYNMVRWSASLTRNAVGPSTTDPRSGEIISSDIFWFHNHIRSYRNRLIIETGAANPKARSLRIDESYLGEAIRQVISHEVGHALGLPHNMTASSAIPVDSLRSPSFTEEHGVSASIMDYARQNYVAQPEDGVTRFIRKIGPYDRYAINWGYRLIPDADTPEEEVRTLRQWILEKEDDPMYRFAEGAAHDPCAQMEALSDNTVRASYYGMKNLRRVVPELTDWATRPGEPYNDLEEIYEELVQVWSWYVNHVITNIGGLCQIRRSAGQEGKVYEATDPERQREAMAFLDKYAFVSPDWLLEPELLRQIEADGTIDRVQSLQSLFLRQLLNPERMKRLLENEWMDSDNAYTLSEMLEDLRLAVWREVLNHEVTDAFRRSLQRLHLDELISLLERESPAGVISRHRWMDIRPLVRREINRLERELEQSLQQYEDDLMQAHLEDLLDEIRRFRDRN